MDLETFVWLVIAFGTGWVLSTLFNRWVFTLLLQQLGISHERLMKLADDLQDAPDTAAITIRLEQHGDMIYAYRKDTEEFVAQGTTGELLLAALVARFPADDKFNIKIVEGADLLDDVAEKPQSVKS
jgi:hypothetical protein